MRTLGLREVMYLVQGHTAKDMNSVYKCLLQNSPFFLVVVFLSWCKHQLTYLRVVRIPTFPQKNIGKLFLVGRETGIF